VARRGAEVGEAQREVSGEWGRRRWEIEDGRLGGLGSHLKVELQNGEGRRGWVLAGGLVALLFGFYQALQEGLEVDLGMPSEFFGGFCGVAFADGNVIRAKKGGV
jgi:hypothetical protein